MVSQIQQFLHVLDYLKGLDRQFSVHTGVNFCHE